MQIMREESERSGFVTDPWGEHSTPGRAAQGKHGGHLPGSSCGKERVRPLNRFIIDKFSWCYSTGPVPGFFVPGSGRLQ